MKTIHAHVRRVALLTSLFFANCGLWAMTIEYSEPQATGFGQEQIEVFTYVVPHVQKFCVGAVSFTLNCDDAGKPLQGRINTLHVQLLWRNKGIASGLLDRALKRMATLGYEEVVWLACPYGYEPMSQRQLEDFYRKRFPGVVQEGSFFTYKIPKGENTGVLKI